MTVTLQVQIEPDRALTYDELCIIYGKMCALCTDLVSDGYVRSEMYRDQEAWHPEN